MWFYMHMSRNDYFACIFSTLIFFLFSCPVQFYLHNHLSLILYFHREKLEEQEVHNYRVVRFEVIPQSVKVEGRFNTRSVASEI